MENGGTCGGTASGENGTVSDDGIVTNGIAPPVTKSLRPMESSPAERRASPGDTLKEELSVMGLGSDASGARRNSPPIEHGRRQDPPLAGERRGRAVGARDGSPARVQPPEDEAEAGRHTRAGPGGGSAARRAAPGDTLKEELSLMRLGSEAEDSDGRMASTLRPN